MGERNDEGGSGGARRAGPGEVLAMRTQGDAEVAQVLATALSADGRVERATHGFHTYPAGLHPDAAAALLAHFPGAVHDPFVGGGTVLVEALLRGRPSSGTDLSPIALLVSRTRTAPPALATPLRAASRALAEQARLRVDVAVPESVASWYEPHVAQEIGRLRDGIAAVEDDGVRGLLWAVLSSIVVKASFRESDTSRQRAPGHRPPGTTAVLFHKKARELGRKLEQLPAEGPRPRLARGDARIKAPPEPVDLVITSPPYPGVYDYVPMQALRYAWLGIDPGRGVADEIASRRSFRADRKEAVHTFRADTAAWIATQARGLVPGGHLVVVVGDGLVGDKPVDALTPVTEGLRDAGLAVVARASADRRDHARARARTEHMICARRA